LEATLRCLQVQAHLGLKKIHGYGHAAGELGPILMEDEEVVNVEDTTDPQLL
jgi:hypothetical protein